MTNLLITAFLMGLAGIPHCTAMCGTACAAALPQGLSAWTLLGRALGYAGLGVIAAAAAGAIAQWGQHVAMIKPLWMMAQLAMVLLGGFMLLRGVIPGVVEQAGKGLFERVRGGWRQRVATWPQWLKPGWPLLAGLAWALLPCGLLYTALMTAALASRPWEGGLVMLAFALPSALGVWAAPRWLRWLRGQTRPAQALGGAPVPVIWMRAEGGCLPDAGARSTAAVAASAATHSAPPWLGPDLAVRVSGLGLACMAGWALWHQLWAQWQAWCA